MPVEGLVAYGCVGAPAPVRTSPSIAAVVPSLIRRPPQAPGPEPDIVTGDCAVPSTCSVPNSPESRCSSTTMPEFGEDEVVPEPASNVIVPPLTKTYAFGELWLFR